MGAQIIWVWRSPQKIMAQIRTTLGALGWGDGKGQALPSGTARPEAYLGQLSNLQVEADDKRIPANPEHQPGCILEKAEVGSGWVGPEGVGLGRVHGDKAQGLRRSLQEKL